ncbi:MAG: hypothetical protein A2170_13475 [Deltaproteobacteria bacterium RBG_13_53_10]|nr:MAG: hypothetical protein A2170_13475 [Deltaproteobacteria bacterium RBG_13_53_10]
MKFPALKGGASREGSFFYIVPLDPVLKDGACGPHAGRDVSTGDIAFRTLHNVAIFVILQMFWKGKKWRGPKKS